MNCDEEIVRCVECRDFVPPYEAEVYDYTTDEEIVEELYICLDCKKEVGV